MNAVFLGIGSNIGDREGHISKALDLLAKKCTVVKKSSLHETKPEGRVNQPMFLNAAAEIETELSPRELMLYFLEIEKQLGRERRIKNGPRTIDLDMLFYNDAVIDTPELTIPHPRMHVRSFVLAPLNEIAPNVVHPILKKNIRDLIFNI